MVTSGVWIAYSWDEGVNLVEFNILTGKGLSKLGGLWNKARSDRRNVGNNDRGFTGFSFD